MHSQCNFNSIFAFFYAMFLLGFRFCSFQSDTYFFSFQVNLFDLSHFKTFG